MDWMDLHGFVRLFRADLVVSQIVLVICLICLESM